jgi:hypothetical protein
LAACSKPQNANPIAALGETRIKNIALASIATEYPALKTSDWRFESMNTVASSNGATMVEVNYILPASADEKQENTPQVQRMTIKMTAVRVTMFPSGKVRDVSKGTFAAVHTTVEK